MQPLVSIIIPTYNRANLIGETLGSVLAQTYKNWECIVVDDGSSDYTDELMKFYCQKDTRIQYHHRPKDRPKGANACRNYGFEVSRGGYIQYLDSDDLISEDKIISQISILCKNKNIDILFCKCVFFKEDSSRFRTFGVWRLLKTCETPKELFDYFGHSGTFLPPHAFLVKRTQVWRAGEWNEYLKINQDGEFFSRVLLTTKLLRFSDGVAFYRKGFDDENTSIYNTREKVEDSIQSWKLIEQQHRLRYKGDNLPYIKKSKETIFKAIITNFPQVIDKNKVFFGTQIKQNSSLKKMIKKIRNWL